MTVAVARRERGLIFTDTMPALHDGSKTQTRRPVKLREFQRSATRGYDWTFRDRRARWNDVTHEQLLARCPLGTVGDRFYAKERWDYFGGDEYIYQREPGAVLYEAGCDLAQVGRRWRNPMFMPRWAARFRAELTAVRVERVQDITEEDARAEIGDALHGVLDDVEIRRLAKLAGCMATDSRAWFAAAWELIHGRGAWERPTWTWALTFRRVEPST